MPLNTILPRVWNARRRAKTYAEQLGNQLKQGIKSLCDNNTAHEYASTFGPRMVLVKVDPADLVCVPYDCSHGKVRVCRYWVIKEVPNETKMRSFFNDKCGKDDTETGEVDRFPNGRVECQDCGTYCDSLDKYCRGCGVELAPVEEEDEAGFCTSCGATLDEEDNFCPSCGHEV